MRNENTAGAAMEWRADTLSERDWLVITCPNEVGESDPDHAVGSYPHAAENIGDILERRLLQGPGFAVIRRLDPPGEPESAAAYFMDWCRRLRLGGLISQGSDGRLVDYVRDERKSTNRGAHTSRALLFHNDMANYSPDIFGLLAVRRAETGGDSLIVSAPAIFTALKEEAPEAAARLTEPCLIERGDDPRSTTAVAEQPIFWSAADGSARVAYNRARIHRGYRLAGERIPQDVTDAMDKLDALFGSPFVLRFGLQRGDVLLANNTTTLHNRTSFRDAPGGDNHRLLLRVWIKSHSPDRLVS